MVDELLRYSRIAREHLGERVGLPASAIPQQPPPAESLVVSERKEFDAVITYNEVSGRHGSGILTRLLFPSDDGILSLRSHSTYDREHQFGEIAMQIPSAGVPRHLIYASLARRLRAASIRRIFCIPYTSADLLLAIALHDLYQAPLCLYIMDDRCVQNYEIPWLLMREALEKSCLAFVISLQMRVAYEERLGRRFYVLPPVVDSQLIRRTALPSRAEPKRAVLVGNIWSQHWLTQLVKTITGSEIAVDWYCNNTDAVWLHYDLTQLESAGIRRFAAIPERELIDRLPEYRFAIVPSGSLDDADDMAQVGRLSFPSRVAFLTAAAIPMLVVGNTEGAAASFITRHGLGFACHYDHDAFCRAVGQFADDQTVSAMRDAAVRLAPIFSNEGLTDWMKQSVDRGRPADDRYECLFAPLPGELLRWFDPPVPAGILEQFQAVYTSLNRIRSYFQPQFVVDIGASTGGWSDNIRQIFPNARFLLIDPLKQLYEKTNPLAMQHFVARNGFDYEACAIGDVNGIVRLKVGKTPYVSSLLAVDGEPVGEMSVPCCTLQEIAVRKHLEGRGLVKIDVQMAEHLVITGSADFFRDHVGVVVLEATIARCHPDAKTLPEMVALLDTLGFRYIDDAGEWRSPQTGILLQKDLVFMKEDLLVDGNL